MPMYKVFESAKVKFVYYLEAESKDDAIDKVDSGMVDPKENDFFESAYEVMEVEENDDA